jgi:transcriptional regulator with PAS, ATPase and Fis domain
MNINNMIDDLNVAVTVANADYDIVYINKKGQDFFRAVPGAENLLGKNLQPYHPPEMLEKLKALYQEYREKKRSSFYVVKDIPGGGKAHIVNVPLYENDQFSGVVEFIFESAPH